MPSPFPSPSSSPSLLYTLPPEILDEIIRLSTFNDVCSNLQLTANEAAVGSSQSEFQTFFTTQTVYLHSVDLERYVTVTQASWLGCTLQHLVLVGTPPPAARRGNGEDTSAPPQEEGEDEETLIALLVRAFEQLRSNSRSGRLQTLRLTVSGTTDRAPNIGHDNYEYPWRSIWHCAGSVARVTASALRASGLEIEKLDAFGDVKRCALSSGRLMPLLQSMTSPSRQLKSLALALSTDESGCEVRNTRSDLGQHLKRLLIHHSHGLEHLNLRWFNHYVDDRADAKSRDIHFFASTATIPLPSLTHLSLGGIRIADSKDLLTFLTHLPHLQHLHLDHLYLQGGKFQPVFAYIAALPTLEYLRLNDLWEEGKLIVFTGATGKSYFPQPGPPTWIERSGPRRRREIAYREMRGRIMGSAPASNWSRQGRLLFGPVS